MEGRSHSSPKVSGIAKLKVAWVSFDFAEYCIIQANALAATNEILLILGVDDKDSLPLPIDLHVESHVFNRPRLRKPIRQFAEAVRIIRTIRAFKPDIIHFQHGHFWFNFVLWWLRKYPLVITAHDPEQHEGDRESRKTPQTVMNLGFRQADHIVVHGKCHVEKVSRVASIEKERVHWVPHVALGITECDFNVSEDENNVLFFGRIWEYKGLEFLIKAEPIVSRVIPGVQFTIAGKGEDIGKYREMMTHSEKFDIRNTWISDRDRSDLFQRAAVVALPYVSSSQSGVIPLAYHYGKPVVATNVGALPEYVVHNETGLIVPPRDEISLAEAIIFLLKNEKIRHKFGQAGRKKCRTEWAPNVVAQSTIDIYKMVLKSDAFTSKKIL